VSRLADFAESGETMSKGVREKVSGWLGSYDFASGAGAWMGASFGARVGECAPIAVDFSNIIKEFVGKGMEGMQEGWDGSRKTTALGHTFCAACAVAPSRDRVLPLHFCFEKGRKPLDARFNEALAAAHEATQGRGVFVVDRGGDSDAAISRLLAKECRAVARVNTLGRDVFGTGKAIDTELAKAPAATAALHKLDNGIRAKLDADAKAAKGAERTREDYARERGLLKPVALRAAQAYLDRWQIGMFFERVKQDFKLEAARVRTFKRLKNLFCLCVLGYVFFMHEVPESAEQARLMKILKDNFQRATMKLQVLVASLRALLGESRLRFISGMPRKQAPPGNPAQLLFAF
jgi:hypothetical protein